MTHRRLRFSTVGESLERIEIAAQTVSPLSYARTITPPSTSVESSVEHGNCLQICAFFIHRPLLEVR